MIDRAPTPGVGPSGVYLPNPVPSGGLWGIVDQITGFALFGTIAALALIIGVGGYILNRLPWKAIGLTLVVVVILLIAKLKGG